MSHVRDLLLANDVRRGGPRVGLRIPVRARRRILRKINRSVKRADGEDEVLYVDEADIDLNKVRLTVARRGRHKR